MLEKDPYDVYEKILPDLKSWFRDNIEYTPSRHYTECKSHTCHMCCPVGAETCPKTPCLIHRIKE